MSDDNSTPPSGSAKGDKVSWRPQEGRDYYFNEQGLMVMTAEYHLRRGTAPVRSQGVRPADGAVLVVGRSDVGYRRLQITTDGRGIFTAQSVVLTTGLNRIRAFAVDNAGNLLAEEEQWAKLARCVEVAEDVWA